MRQRLIALEIFSFAIALSCGRPGADAEKDAAAPVAMAKTAKLEISSSAQSRSAEKSKPSVELDSVGPIHDPYGLRVTDGTAASGFGIVGPVDTLRVDHHRAVVLFPGDTAHWHFGTCTSAEGVHYVIDRLSADSLVELWDGYYHVDYDLESSCNRSRDLARANDARARLAEWKAGRRTHDVAMSLIVARWIRCRHAGVPVVGADSAVADSMSYPAALPAMADLLRGLGTPNDGRPEDAFILGWLGREQQDCFDAALPLPPDSLVANAARRDTSSALFRYYRDANKPRGKATDALVEAGRRFAGRGEHYRAILDWLREELRGD